MSARENVQVVESAFAAMSAGDTPSLLALCAEHIEWVIPGEGWPLAGTYRGHAGLEALLRTASETMQTTFCAPPEFVAQGNIVMVMGVAQGSIKSTARTWQDHWVFAITVRNGKLTSIREYIDTQALARAAETT